MAGLGKTMLTVKKWSQKTHDKGWDGHLAGLNWDRLNGEVIETWKWTLMGDDKKKKQDKTQHNNKKAKPGNQAKTAKPGNRAKKAKPGNKAKPGKKANKMKPRMKPRKKAKAPGN